MTAAAKRWVWWVQGLGTRNPRLVKCAIVRMGPKRITLAGEGFFGQRTFARVSKNRLGGLNGDAVKFNAIEAVTNAIGNLEYQISIDQSDIKRKQAAVRKLSRTAFLGKLVRYAKVINK